jgi:hypothetical protein
MSKYEPLERYLREQQADEVPLTFRDIEKIIGGELPASQFSRAWWSNNPNNNVMTSAWLAADYMTEKVDIKNRRLVFRRIGAIRARPLSQENRERHTRWYGAEPAWPGRHPLFGWMKGTVSMLAGVDLTEPADPEWAQRIDDEFPTSS